VTEELERIYQDLQIALIHEEGFELTKQDVKEILDVLDPIMEGGEV